jgi:hypothetical protein
VLSQSGPRMAASIRLVTHACPAAIDAGGCSLWSSFGTIQDTLGRLPAPASSK